MRTWCNQHPIAFMGYYSVVYLCFFFLLERTVTAPELVLHCRLDDMIPFCKYAIVPYGLWFFWIAFSLFYLLWRAPREEFWRLVVPLFTGMMLSLLFCAVVPNGVYLRPRAVPGDDIFAWLVRRLYATDTATNVFPSIHVFNSVTIDMAYQRSSCFAGRRRRWVRVLAHVLDVSIVLSTLLLKQHSVLDATAGLVLALALEMATAYLWHEPVYRRSHLVEQPGQL